MKNLKDMIKQDKQILIAELGNYGSYVNPKYKNSRDKKYNCCNCTSSDALGIKKANKGYIYHCFSCGTTGDVISLVQEKEGITFTEALNYFNDTYSLGYDLKPFRKANTKSKPNPIKLKIEALQTVYNTYVENGELEEACKILGEIRALKEPNESPIYYYDEKLSEQAETIREILNEPGLTLINAPTGSGKTYTIVKIFKELAQESIDRVFIILCPNRVQNEQNGKEYNINVIVGGKKAEQFISVSSGVYEKIKEINEAYRDKQITLVVDEAHELIESIGYRKKSIEEIDQITEKTFNTIHLTATDRKLLEYYNYNFRYKFEPSYKQNNLQNLSIIRTDDIVKTFYTLVKDNHEKGLKSLAFISGSKKDIKDTGDTLRKQGYKVGIITSEDKQSSLYLNIVENSTIPDDYDIVLSTKVLECGTNIKNTNIVPIEVVKNNNHFNLDSTEQKFARLRNYNENGYIVIKKQEEKKEIKPFSEILKELEYTVENSIKGIEYLIKGSKTDLDGIRTTLKESIKLTINAVTGACGNCIEFNEETFEVTINRKKLINKAFNEYDKQFLYNTDALKKELESRIKAIDIGIIENPIELETSEAFKKELKEIKKLNKEAKEENQNAAKETIKKLHENGYLIEYLASEDKFELLQNFKIHVSKDLYNSFCFLEDEEAELEKIKTLYNVEILKDNLDLLMKYYDNCKNKAEANRIAKHFNYLRWNQVSEGTPGKEVYSSYAVLRRAFDRVKDKQGRITQRDILTVTEELYNKKLLWQFDKQRMKQDYESYINETDKKKKEKAFKKICDKTIHELGLIYEIRKDKKGTYISSLK